MKIFQICNIKLSKKYQWRNWVKTWAGTFSRILGTRTGMQESSQYPANI